MPYCPADTRNHQQYAPAGFQSDSRLSAQPTVDELHGIVPRESKAVATLNICQIRANGARRD
jgi:hypothetical protein